MRVETLIELLHFGLVQGLNLLDFGVDVLVKFGFEAVMVES